MTVSLHPQLVKDCLPVTSLGICRVYLQNNSHFPWLVLIPMRDGLSEIFDMNMEDYEQVMSEVRHVTKYFSSFTGADKMNVAALGNIVPQLHIHIIARFKDDKAWPNPVWNTSLPPAPYPSDKSELLIRELRAIL